MKSAFSVRRIAFIALFVALIAVCAWISIPVGEIAFTMQTFAVFAAAGLLGTRDATISMIVYLLLGAIGLPVFSRFTGGIGVLLGASGGYIIGFVFSALLTGFLLSRIPEKGKAWKRIALSALAMLAGLIVCYAFGTAWFVLVYAPRAAKSVTVLGALSACVFPYILPDLVKIALAYLLTDRLKPVLARYDLK